MIVAERKAKVNISKLEQFGEAMSDGRLTVPSNGKIFSLRDANKKSKKLGRPLTEGEIWKQEDYIL